MKRGNAVQILSEAESLGIPWQTILLDEILAEKTWQRNLAGAEVEWPLSYAFSFLPNTLIHSWRVRERLDRLSWEASADHSRDAARLLRALYLHLAGKRSPSAPISFVSTTHFWVAYRRVLQLQRILRCAQRGRGSTPEAMAEAVARTGCTREDAEWAIESVLSASPRHGLDEAMRRAREEGYELPHARSEPRAFLRLKDLLRRRGFLPGRGRPSRAVRKAVEAEETRCRAERNPTVADLGTYLQSHGPARLARSGGGNPTS